MAKTLLKKVSIKSFRALRDVEISFGTDITVLCGKNGTAKSSILGIAAQIFSFDKDYTTGTQLSYKTITDENYKSQFSDHFRISPNFDLPGSMEVGIDVYDGYTASNATGDLTITTRDSRRGKVPRVVVRNNSTAEEGKNKDRNFTHPVIFLSLKRLFPIASREKYIESTFEYLDVSHNKQEFIKLTNELLGKQVQNATVTTGTLKSTVSHGDNYDCHSVSTGEDNIGQIVLAILSFRKLKDEYGANYKGGLLLIDEADAGLFPAAQKKLIDVLDRECRNLKLQVILTSHSTTLIEKIYDNSQLDYNRSRYKTVYLTDTYGGIEVRNDWDWVRIYADINIQPIALKPTKLPKINVYFEDNEALSFFNALTYRHKVKKILNIFGDVSLGCTNYIHLIKNARVPEFRDRSVICLDGDAKDKVKGLPSVVLLPGYLPPDQLIFEFLYNLPANHSIWTNSNGFTRPVFRNIASDLIQEFSIDGDNIDLAGKIKDYKGSRKPRELFKTFFNKDEFLRLLTVPKEHNPWKLWISSNEIQCEKFVSQFVARIKYILKHIHGFDAGRIAFLDAK
jgi:predicted ATPase